MVPGFLECVCMNWAVERENKRLISDYGGKQNQRSLWRSSHKLKAGKWMVAGSRPEKNKQ